MTLWPGDEVGDGFTLERLVAYQGKTDCESWSCTRVGSRQREDGSWEMGQCRGYHCARCDEPTSMMGHDCPLPFPRQRLASETEPNKET